MPRFNTTIDDNSPLITYSPTDAWHPGSAETDRYANNYANGTFTLTGQVGATAKFTFYGTGIWLYGAKRPNHGMYTVTLDGQQSEEISGRRSDGIRDINVRGNEFDAVLYRAFNLSLTTHEAVLTNQGSQGAALDAIFVDIDFITWESDLGGDDASLSTTTLDSSNFQTSGSGWGSAAANSALGSTEGIYTDVPGDTLEFTFESVPFSITLHQGNAVEVYGSTGQACGLFSVQVDGGVSTIYNGTTSHNFTDQLIFFALDLGSGQHTLTMTNSQLSNGTLVVDHARVQVVQPTASLGAISGNNTGSTSSSNSGPAKALIGGLCGALAFLLVVLVTLFLWVKRRRRVAVVSRKTESSRFEAFDIDQSSPPPSQVTMRQASLSDVLRASMARSESRSDSSSSWSQPCSHKILNSVSSREKLKQSDDPRMTTDERLAKFSLDALAGNASSSKLPPDMTGRTVSNNRTNRGPRNGHRSHKHHHKPTKNSTRPLPTIPRAASGTHRIADYSRANPLVPALELPHRSTSMLKGRRRSVRNSRLVQAGYNILFAHPGSSNSSSAYAPTTVFTSEISERPTTTLSPVTEAAPPLPPSRSQSPQTIRTLQIANRVDGGWDIS